MLNSRHAMPLLAATGLAVVALALLLGKSTLNSSSPPNSNRSAPGKETPRGPSSEPLALSDSDRAPVEDTSPPGIPSGVEVDVAGVQAHEASLALSSFPDLGSALGAYYGVSAYEVEQHLTEQMGLDAKEVLAMEVDSLKPWESVSEKVLAGLVSKVNAATPWSNERLIAELLGQGKGELQTTIREALLAFQTEEYLGDNLELAVQHGLSTAGAVQAAHSQLFSAMQVFAVEKTLSGQLDVFPVVNINALLTHTRGAESAIFWAQHSDSGWTAQVACFRGENPRIENAMRARDQSFEQWWAEVKLIAGL